MQEFLQFMENKAGEIPTWLMLSLLVSGGILLSLGLGALVQSLLRLLKFDRFSQKSGLDDMLHKGKVAASGSRFVGRGIRLLGIMATLAGAAAYLDPSTLQTLQRNVLDVLPGLFAAVILLVVGLLFINFLGNFTTTLIRNAGRHYSSLAGRIIKVCGSVVVISMATSQLSIDMSLFNTLLLIVAGTVGLATALAFGTGCKDLAAEAMKRWLRELRESTRDHDKPDLEG